MHVEVLAETTEGIVIVTTLQPAGVVGAVEETSECGEPPCIS